jgi:predicted LPLAT superfamily acyltransferase
MHVDAADGHVPGKNKVVTSTLHGAQISLAKGPFSLATTSGIDVIMASAMKEKDGSYTAYFTPLHYDKTLPKSQQRQQIADAYTAEIERLLAYYPMQWFNYSDLWVSPAS